MPDSENSSVVMVSATPEQVVEEVAADPKPAEEPKQDGEKEPAQNGDNKAQASNDTESKDKDEKKKKVKKNGKKGKKSKAADTTDSDSDGDSSDDSDDEDSKEKILVGAVAGHKNLYQKFDKNNCMSWTDKYPQDLEEAAENDETLKYAVIVRNRRPKDDSRKVLEIDSIIIQSPFIKRVLGKVLKDYPGVNTSLTRLTFSSPFQCFVHRWDRLTAEMASDEWDDTTKGHLQVLYDILHPELKDVITTVQDYLKNKVVSYKHIWTIFQPGCTLFGSRYGHPIGLKFQSGFHGESQTEGPCYIMSTTFVDWDGTAFGHSSMAQSVPAFAGVIPITDLPCFPLDFHPDLGGTVASLAIRGQLFEQLAGYHYKHYNGQGITKVNGCTVRVTVNSRVVIDAAMYAKYNPNMTRSLQPLRRSALSGNNTFICGSDNDSYYESDYDSDADDADLDDKKPTKKISLTPEELILCTPMVKGYALKAKRWLEFYVGDMSEVVYNAQAFNSLVLPEDQKELILAFAQTQVQVKDEFDDVIQGKGKGIIMLLSGGPGIGKTLTAESVAEEMRVPLYVMSAGDLGGDADNIEYNLTQTLEMVAKWNAVLLLDECDVFLEARSPHDLDRNRIVSIFLRTLEYYEGILFLTTNRVNDMDPAFHSRIHISLEYPPLDEAARKSVWVGFLERNVAKGSAAHGLSEEEVDKLAKLEINGRQIKNVLKTANLLACHKKQKLSFVHLRTVLKVEGYKIE